MMILPISEWNLPNLNTKIALIITIRLQVCAAANLLYFFLSEIQNILPSSSVGDLKAESDDLQIILNVSFLFSFALDNKTKKMF